MALRTAGEIMNKNVITINGDRNILELAELFIKNKISGVPVVDNENILQGIVSETDIVNFIKKDNISYRYSYMPIDLYAKAYEENKEALSNTKVEKIMNTWVKKAKKETLESEIAAIMGENKVNRVPVVDDENKVLGIIARSDLIKSMIE
ncbi:MAG: CBS domain-containing protein [Candidatus Humimicrobiaceae bacterium]